MFDWLVEGRLPVYLVLLTVAIILVAVWWQRRSRRWLIAVAAVLGLVALYALLDRLIETPYEQMVRKVNEMAATAQKRDPASLNANLADSFDYHGVSKAALLRVADGRIRSGDVRDVIVWDFERGPISREDRTGRIDFFIKVKTSFTRDELFFRCHATFTLDADGQWRMQTFELFDPTGVGGEVPVQFGAS